MTERRIIMIYGGRRQGRAAALLELLRKHQAMPMPTDLDRAIDAQARSLRDFGYPDVTAQRVREAHERWKKDEDPVGIIDRFCFSAFEEHPALFGTMDMK